MRICGDEGGKGDEKALLAGGSGQQIVASGQVQTGEAGDTAGKAAGTKDHIKITMPQTESQIQRDSLPVIVRRRSKAGWFDLHERKSVRIFLAELIGTLQGCQRASYFGKIFVWQ